MDLTFARRGAFESCVNESNFLSFPSLVDGTWQLLFIVASSAKGLHLLLSDFCQEQTVFHHIFPMPIHKQQEKNWKNLKEHRTEFDRQTPLPVLAKYQHRNQTTERVGQKVN